MDVAQIIPGLTVLRFTCGSFDRSKSQQREMPCGRRSTTFKMAVVSFVIEVLSVGAGKVNATQDRICLVFAALNAHSARSRSPGAPEAAVRRCCCLHSSAVPALGRRRQHRHAQYREEKAKESKNGFSRHRRRPTARHMAACACGPTATAGTVRTQVGRHRPRQGQVDGNQSTQSPRPSRAGGRCNLSPVVPHLRSRQKIQKEDRLRAEGAICQRRSDHRGAMLADDRPRWTQPSHRGLRSPPPCRRSARSGSRRSRVPRYRRRRAVGRGVLGVPFHQLGRQVNSPDTTSAGIGTARGFNTRRHRAAISS
jgi:hypothetical protein